jgi:hypothetical protein
MAPPMVDCAPSPWAIPNAPVTVAPRPMAMPELAAAATDDWPPTEIPFAAAACAPLAAFDPMAMAPAPDAVVELATLSGVVPLPPEPPMATALSPGALLPKPIAMLDMPPAEDSRPKAVDQRLAVLRNPRADAPMPVALAKTPYTVTAVTLPPFALQPATVE